MRWLAAVARWELRLQLRSTRTRVALLAYFVVCAVPGLVVFSLTRYGDYGTASYLVELLKVQPWMSVVLATLVAGARTNARARARMWPVLSAVPASDAKILLGRWLALQALLLPAAVVPLVFTASLARAGAGSWPAATWLWLWALYVVLLLLTVSAAWFSVTTILGGDGPALGVCLMGPTLVEVILNHLLVSHQLKLDGASTLATFLPFANWLDRLPKLLGAGREIHMVSLHVTAAALDPRPVLEWRLPHLAPGLALTGLVLGLAVIYVRRTRRDLKPRTVASDHALATYLKALLSLRERLAPGAAYGRGDRLAVAAGLAVFLLGFGLVFERQVRFRNLAEERFQAEMREIPTLASEVHALDWHLVGTLARDSSLAAEFRGTLVNRGDEPQSHLAFSLNAGLELTDVTARRGDVDVDVDVERHWDRLVVTVEPPLLRGETLELSCRLRGVPGDLRFSLGPLGRKSFTTAYARHREAWYSYQLSDLSASYLRRAATPSHVRLTAADLAPTPRYTSWAVESDSLALFMEVPEEEARRRLALEIDLTAPHDWLLADACGQTSRAEPSCGDAGPCRRLRGSCQAHISEYEVRGGAFASVDEGPVTLAVHAGHQAAAASWIGSMSEAVLAAERAWPGLLDLGEGLVAVEELLDDPVLLLETGESLHDDWPLLVGRLAVIPEASFLRGSVSGTRYFFGFTLAGKLMERREVAEEELAVFRELYRTTTFQRMGLSGKQDARVSGPSWRQATYRRAILGVEGREGVTSSRLSPLLFDLQARIGAAAFRGGVDAFLAGSGPGTFEDLLKCLEEAGGISLRRFADDFIYGGAVPELALEETRAQRRGSGWEVRGTLRNSGTGEVVCPLVVKTEVAVRKLLVTVGSREAKPFHLVTETRPVTAELDPEGTCYRLVTSGASTLERVDLTES